MTRDEVIAFATKHGACSESLAWVTATHGEPAELWDACERSDWMVWIARKLIGDAFDAHAAAAYRESGKKWNERAAILRTRVTWAELIRASTVTEQEP